MKNPCSLHAVVCCPADFSRSLLVVTMVLRAYSRTVRLDAGRRHLRVRLARSDAGFCWAAFARSVLLLGVLTGARSVALAGAESDQPVAARRPVPLDARVWV